MKIAPNMDLNALQDRIGNGDNAGVAPALRDELVKRYAGRDDEDLTHDEFVEALNAAVCGG